MDSLKFIIDAISWKDIISVLMGGVITWFVAWVYYERASSDLKKEASDLLSLSKITLRALEDAGLCELNRDKDGKITGLTYRLQAGVSNSVSLSGQVTSMKAERNE